jgi:isopentenyl-diphosphate delta-isomerase
VTSDSISERKSEHIDLALRLGDRAGSSAGWSDVTLVHDALPDVDLEDVDLTTDVLGRPHAIPLLISGMTGGHPRAVDINRALARAAQATGAMIGLGSQRAGLLDPAKVESYRVVREEAPSAFVLGNIGIAQLVEQDASRRLGIDDVRAAIDMVRADALAVHLNFVEEVVQPEGQTRARGAAKALGELVAQLDVPVLVKETGCGLSRGVAVRLRDLGVQALDTGGWGGTSFALIEAARADHQKQAGKAAAGEALASWGIPTAVSVALCAGVLPTVAVGGVRGGVDAAKALALGAAAVGVGRPMLERAVHGADAVLDWIESFLYELRAACFLTGSANLAELRSAPRLVSGRTKEWLEAVAPGTADQARQT